MALKDRVSIDATGIDAGKQEALLKGVALAFNVKDENGDLDISSPAQLTGYIKEKVARILIAWAKKAQRYEVQKNASIVDITDA